MADSSPTSHNPFRRKAAPEPADGIVAPTPHTPFSAAFGTPLGRGAEAAGISGTSAAASLFEQHLHSLESHHPTGTEFREQLRALPKSVEAAPSTTFVNPKPIKKVRVQSPPPSSPDSIDAEFETRFPAHGPPEEVRHEVHFAETPSYEYSSGSDDDAVALTTTPPATTTLTTLATPQSAAPHNPFHQTEGEGATTAPAAGKGSLDVDAFRRLLLTGRTGGGEVGSATATTTATPTLIPTARPAGAAVLALPSDTGSFTDASSISKHSTFDATHTSVLLDSPRTSHDVSETDDDRSGSILALQTAPAQRHVLRKKPPPPSSRHGKLITSPRRESESTDEGAAAIGPPHRRTSAGSIGRPSSSSSDMNKPLPAPPVCGQADEHAESIFDREAAGKIPEVDLDPDASDDVVPVPRPPTPPNASHSSAFSPSHPISELGIEALSVSSTSLPPPTTATAMAAPMQPTMQAKRPPPPPRRQAAHVRSDSRSSGRERVPSGQSTTSLADSVHERSPSASRRSSFESTRSRSSSLKQGITVPAPPPPRRPHHASRPSLSFMSPTTTTFGSMSAASSPSLVADADRSLGLGSPLTPATAHALEHANAETESLYSLHRENSIGAKTARPPPPPTRNISVRKKDGSGRPLSVLGFDAASRRIPPHAHQQPPPPPPRARGSSRGSMDTPLSPPGGAVAGAAQPRKASGDSVQRTGGSALTPAPAQGGSVNSSAANTILADLDALQREVDALRGQFN